MDEKLDSCADDYDGVIGIQRSAIGTLNIEKYFTELINLARAGDAGVHKFLE